MVVVVVTDSYDAERIVGALACIDKVMMPFNVAGAILVWDIAVMIRRESVELVADVLGNGASERHTL